MYFHIDFVIHFCPLSVFVVEPVNVNVKTYFTAYIGQSIFVLFLITCFQQQFRVTRYLAKNLFMCKHPHVSIFILKKDYVYECEEKNSLADIVQLSSEYMANLIGHSVNGNYG